jgi:purine-nucleoside phosphorylase
MQGRFHAYEGYSSALCTMPIRVFKLFGVEKIILTCAAGSVNESFKVGDIMVIKDHISIPLLALQHPLVGHNDEKFGPRFTPANRLYNKHFRKIFSDIAKELNIDIREGEHTQGRTGSDEK